MKNENNNTETKTVKLGRPVGDDKVKWNKVALLWPNKTDREISEWFAAKGGRSVSVVSVFLKRRKLAAMGKKVACKKPKFSRIKKVEVVA